MSAQRLNSARANRPAKAFQRVRHKLQLLARRPRGVLAARDWATKIDLLVLDVVMPGLSGLQTLEKLRNQGHTELPVVLLTAQSADEAILGGYKKGADGYLTKPLQPKALLNIVDYLIGDLTPEERAKLEPLL